MHKFSFKLQKILEYKEALEKKAKEEHLQKRAGCIAVEEAIQQIIKQRNQVLLSSETDLDSLQNKERYLLKLDEEERYQKIALCVLLDEEEKSLAKWQKKYKEAEVFKKLKEHKKQTWLYLLNKEEQNQLDDFSIMRRKAS